MKASFYVPVPTLFREDGRIDFDANGRHYDRLIAAGIDGIALLGSTGEFFALREADKKALFQFAAEYIGGRVKLLAGTGGMDPDETIRLNEYAAQAGIGDALVVGPYYFGLDDERLFHFYDKIASASACNLFIYNFPALTGNDISPELTVRLLECHETIVGYKDTVTGMEHTRRLLAATERFEGFQVFSGFEDSFAYNILSGGAGCIGALANLAPEFYVAWTTACRNDDLPGIAAGQRTADRLAEFYSVAKPAYAALKRAMKLRGLIECDLCAEPVCPLSPKEDAALEEFLHAQALK